MSQPQEVSGILFFFLNPSLFAICISTFSK
jgi:hypothetical protein